MNSERLRIFLPFLLALALSFTPQAVRMSSSLQAAEAVRLHGNPESMEAHLTDILAFEPWRVALWEPLGASRYQNDHFDEAILAFQQAEGYGYLSEEGAYRLAAAYEKLENIPAALFQYQKMLQDGIKSEIIYEKVVRYQRQEGEIAGAADTLREWIAFQPANAKTYYSLGLLLCLSQPSQARVYLEQAASMDPAYIHPVSGLSKALYDSSFSDDPAYQKIILGRALGNVEQWDLAQIAFQESVQINPAYAEAWAFLAEAQQKNGKSGYDSLQTALNLNPESILVRSLAAVYWRRQADPQKALEFLYGIQKEEPQQAVWVVEIASVLAESGDIPLALEYYQEAVSLEPQDPFYWRSLAMFCGQNHTEVDTIGFPAARKALILAPDDPLSLDTMGWLLFSQGDNYSAERFFLQALQHDDGNPLIHYHLSQVYLNRLDYAEAYPYLVQAFLLSKPDSELGVLAARLIKQYYSDENQTSLNGR